MVVYWSVTLPSRKWVTQGPLGLYSHLQCCSQPRGRYATLLWTTLASQWQTRFTILLICFNYSQCIIGDCCTKIWLMDIGGYHGLNSVVIVSDKASSIGLKWNTHTHTHTHTFLGLMRFFTLFLCSYVYFHLSSFGHLWNDCSQIQFDVDGVRGVCATLTLSTKKDWDPCSCDILVERELLGLNICFNSKCSKHLLINNGRLYSILMGNKGSLIPEDLRIILMLFS